MNKKAQIGNLQALVITLVTIGIILGIGFLILEEFKTQARTDSVTIRGETLTSVDNSTGETVAHATDSGFIMDTDVDCINTTTGDTIPDSNVTATSAGVIKSVPVGSTCVLDDHGFCNWDWNCTYHYSYGREAWIAVNETLAATAKIPQWLGIVVILAIVGILLAILFAVFPRIGTGGASFGRGGSGGVTAEV